jgi:hypothetical protein
MILEAINIITTETEIFSHSLKLIKTVIKIEITTIIGVFIFFILSEQFIVCDVLFFCHCMVFRCSHDSLC